MTIRARDLGIRIGHLAPGPRNAITDVAGVRVGHATIVEGDGPLVVGRGPVRTGVTVVLAHDGDPFREGVFAGCHRLNGNGELTGLEWIREAGLLGSPIAITNTHSVGVVRDALCEVAALSAGDGPAWALPVVGETYDGALNDIDGRHVRDEHVRAALADASETVVEGNVGGGTGMICHRFKGGIGSASRRLAPEDGGFTVGVLVQANYGDRERLAIDGIPVGREIPASEAPDPWLPARPSPADTGSIIVVVATDAPLLPGQCERLAQRAGLGVARAGGGGAHSSGDLFIAFATGNRRLPAADRPARPIAIHELRMLDDAAITPLFWGVIEATEEAIANALVAARTMTGINGTTAHAIDHDRLREVVARHMAARRG